MPPNKREELSAALRKFVNSDNTFLLKMKERLLHKD